MAFPPVPVYPIKLDSDRTLFLVYNTTETKLAVDNQPWAEEIEIDAATSNEIWADNGFGNISGELFYYDSVSKDIDGKVIKLKGCARNIGGNQTRFSLAGTWVRSYVIAEHHNQLVDAIMNLEAFLLDLNLDLELLENEATCADDFNCANVALIFDVEPAVICGETQATYSVDVTGNYTTVTINFGDGSTSTNLTGTYTYPPNANIDPIVAIENDSCLTIQTPADRTTGDYFDIPPTTPLSIPLCVIPELPPINIPSLEMPSLTLTFPQIILPSICISIPAISIPSIYMSISVTICPISIISCFIPSVISFASVEFPLVSFASVSFPTVSFASISFPTISFASITFPTISFASITFPTISFASITFPTISITNPSLIVPPITNPSLIVPPIIVPPITVDWGTAPAINVNWGACDCTIKVSCVTPAAFAPTKVAVPFAANLDTFEDNPVITIPTPQALGIPTEIKITVPEFKQITLQHDLPQVIEVISPNLPKTINIQGPEIPLPTEIRIVGEIPDSIRLDAKELPQSIKIDSSGLPTAIALQPMNLPSVIMIDASDIPDTIQITGIPSAIELKGHLPSEIYLKIPENLEIPLVYRGGPIPVQFDLGKLADADADDPPCFAIIPCPKR